MLFGVDRGRIKDYHCQEVEMVRVADPEPLIEVGLKEPHAPAGSPDTLSPRVLENPWIGVTVAA
jgi:hypothetical protein